MKYIRAASRAKPRTTGSTASRCEGFGISFRWILSLLFPLTLHYHSPNGIFTSPYPLFGLFLPFFKLTENLLISFTQNISQVHFSAVKPCQLTSFTSKSQEILMMASNAAMVVSPYSSRPNLSWPTYFVCKNFQRWLPDSSFSKFSCCWLRGTGLKNSFSISFISQFSFFIINIGKFKTNITWCSVSCK